MFLAFGGAWVTLNSAFSPGCICQALSFNWLAGECNLLVTVQPTVRLPLVSLILPASTARAGLSTYLANLTPGRSPLVNSTLSPPRLPAGFFCELLLRAGTLQRRKGRRTTVFAAQEMAGCPVLNGQHSKHFQWKHGISLDASGTVAGAYATPNRRVG